MAETTRTIGSIELERIKVARLQPGDVLVVELDQVVSQETKRHIEAMLQPHFPNNKILVCDQGVRLSVVERGEKQFEEAVVRVIQKMVDQRHG